MVADEGNGVNQEYFLKMRVTCLHDDGNESSRQGKCSGAEERGDCWTIALSRLEKRVQVRLRSRFVASSRDVFMYLHLRRTLNTFCSVTPKMVENLSFQLHDFMSAEALLNRNGS